MVLLFVVCGWREEAVAGVFLRKYSVHSTYVFFCTRATKVGKIVNPAVVEYSTQNTLVEDSLYVLPTFLGVVLPLSRE
jgi:hypothetical protein